MPDLGDLGDLGRIWANGIRPYRDQTEPRFFPKNRVSLSPIVRHIIPTNAMP